MGIGIIGKALAGAGGAAKDASMEAMRAEIMAQRDARLNEYAKTMQTDVVQPFQTSEREASQQFQAGQTEKGQQFTASENAKNRDLQAKQIDAVVKQANVAYQKGMIEVDSLKQLKDLQKAYMNAKTPEEAGQIADQLYTLQGKDKYTPLIGKDEMGNPVFMGAFSTRSGERKTETTTPNNDPLGLRGGGAAPAAAKLPTNEEQADRTRAALGKNKPATSTPTAAAAPAPKKSIMQTAMETDVAPEPLPMDAAGISFKELNANADAVSKAVRTGTVQNLTTGQLRFALNSENLSDYERKSVMRELQARKQ